LQKTISLPHYLEHFNLAILHLNLQILIAAEVSR